VVDVSVGDGPTLVLSLMSRDMTGAYNVALSGNHAFVTSYTSSPAISSFSVIEFQLPPGPSPAPTPAPTLAPTPGPTRTPTLVQTALPTLAPTLVAAASPSPGQAEPNCFAGEAITQAPEWKSVPMAAVQVGDKALVTAGGKWSHEIVFAFLHSQHQVTNTLDSFSYYFCTMNLGS